VYWTSRGYTIDEAKEKVSEYQSKRSKRSLLYWTSRGYSSDEAKIMVSKNQSRNKLFYKNKYGDEWEQHYNDDMKNKDSTSITFHKNKYGDNWKKYYDARCKLADGSSEDFYKNKYGDEWECEYRNNNKKKGSVGNKNPQWGLPAPKGSGCGFSGYYKGEYFRSILEYRYLKHFEENDISYISNDVSADKHESIKVVIPYIDSVGKQRNYIPDFLIGNTIVEVKPKALIKLNIEKFESANRYIRDDSHYDKFEIYTENEVEVYDVLDDIKKGNVIIDKGKLDRFNSKYLK